MLSHVGSYIGVPYECMLGIISIRLSARCSFRVCVFESVCLRPVFFSNGGTREKVETGKIRK